MVGEKDIGLLQESGLLGEPVMGSASPVLLRRASPERADGGEPALIWQFAC